MISGLIPHRYAMALYKYAQESDSQEPIYEAMKTVLGAYSENKDLQKNAVQSVCKDGGQAQGSGRTVPG